MFTRDTKLPSEFTIGPVGIPAVYVKLAGLASMFGLISLVLSLFSR